MPPSTPQPRTGREAELPSQARELARLRARVAELERGQQARLAAEQALRESEARYRELVDQCPDPIAVHRDGILLFLNDAAARMAGPGVISRDLIGRHVIEFVHADERRFASDAIQRVSAGEPPLGVLETRVYDAQGNERIVEVTDRVIAWQGKPAVQVVIRDVTARRRGEDALRSIQTELEQRVEQRTGELSDALIELRQSEAQQRAMLKASPDSLSRIHRDGTVLDVHAGGVFAEHFDLDRQVGRNVSEMLPEASAKLAQKAFDRICDRGGVERLEYRSDFAGDVRFFEARLVACGSDEILVIMRDITEAKRSYAKLRDREERFRKVFEEGPLGMALTADLRLQEVNSTLCRALGYTREELEGRSILDVTHPADWPAGMDAIRRLAAGESPSVTMEKRYLHKEGHEIPFRITLSLMRDVDGEASYGIAMFEDVREERRAAAALRDAQARLHHSERMASIGTLAAGIAHEINNPIGSILLAAQWALADEDARSGEALRRSLLEIEDHARRCGGIVKNVLRFAHQETLERVDGDLNECVERVRELASHLAERRGVDIEFDLAPEPLPVHLNPTAVEQVLLNVVRNAVEAGEHDGPVRVTTARDETGACIVVRDQGRGMGAEEKTYLFDPFYTTRRAEGGTGLGLSISHGIITDHGGRIQVESQPGRGTEVTVILPFSDSDADSRRGE